MEIRCSRLRRQFLSGAMLDDDAQEPLLVAKYNQIVKVTLMAPFPGGLKHYILKQRRRVGSRAFISYSSSFLFPYFPNLLFYVSSRRPRHAIPRSLTRRNNDSLYHNDVLTFFPPSAPLCFPAMSGLSSARSSTSSSCIYKHQQCFFTCNHSYR